MSSAVAHSETVTSPGVHAAHVANRRAELVRPTYLLGMISMQGQISTERISNIRQSIHSPGPRGVLLQTGRSRTGGWHEQQKRNTAKKPHRLHR